MTQTVARGDREGAAPLWKELRAPLELGLFVGLAPLLRAVPPGPSRSVLVVPGFGIDDRATLPLRGLLRALGHRPRGWGLGPNRGPTPEAMDGLARRLAEVTERTGAPVPIVGWSLGGVYGRALAQWYPERVDQVISLGSPFNLGAREQGSLITDLYARAERTGRFIRRRGEIDLDAIACPSTSIYTRSDGIVPWRACLQSEGPTAENVEVRGSHCGLGSNVTAAWVIADRLRHRADDWRPFQAPAATRCLFPADDPCAN